MVGDDQREDLFGRIRWWFWSILVAFGFVDRMGYDGWIVVPSGKIVGE